MHKSIDDARSAFTEARFLDAAGLAEAVGTSRGYALAARSLAVHGYYVATEEDRGGFFERAMELAEEAVRADSTNPEAYFQSAHAVGRYAQTVGTITALRRGLAGKIRDLLEAAITLYPDFTEAHVALGGWHTDIVGAGFIARSMYGGSLENAVAHFERAMELEPESKVVLLEYAARLLALDGERGRERARELLSKALELPVWDASEEFLQQDIVEALEGE